MINYDRAIQLIENDEILLFQEILENLTTIEINSLITAQNADAKLDKKIISPIGRNLLQYATHYGRYEIVNALLTHGVSKEAENFRGSDFIYSLSLCFNDFVARVQPEFTDYSHESDCLTTAHVIFSYYLTNQNFFQNFIHFYINLGIDKI